MLPPRLWSVSFVMLIAAAFAEALSFTALYPVLPKLVSQAGGDATAIGLVMGSFNFASIVARPTAGWLSDRFGRRILLLGGAALSIMAILPVTLISSTLPLVLLRMMHGCGEAAFYVAAATAVTDIAPSEQRAEGVSIFSLAFFAALGLGPWFGDAVAAHGFTAALVFAASSSAVALIVTATIPLPIVPPSRELRFSDLINTSALFPGILFSLTLMGYAGFTGFILIYADELSLTRGAWLFGVFASIVAAARLLGRKVPDRLGARPIALGSMLLISVGLGLLGLRPDWPVALIGTVILAIGQAWCFPALLLLALARGGEDQRGAIVGTLVGFLDIGVGLGSLLFGIVGAAAGYDVAFLVAAGGSIGAALMLWTTGSDQNADR